MGLTTTSCNGGSVLEWTAVSHPAFHRYITLRSTSGDVPPMYPPQGGAEELGWTKSKDPGTTSAGDPSGVPWVNYFYRTLALDAASQVIGASSVASSVPQPVQGLGPLAVFADGSGKTKFAWTPYGGSGECFTYYKLVYSETDPSPSYPNGDPYWAAIGDQSADRAVVEGLVPGTTYHVRLQAIRATGAGSFVVGQTDVLTYTAP